MIECSCAVVCPQVTWNIQTTAALCRTYKFLREDEIPSITNPTHTATLPESAASVFYCRHRRQRSIAYGDLSCNMRPLQYPDRSRTEPYSRASKCVRQSPLPAGQQHTPGGGSSASILSSFCSRINPTPAIFLFLFVLFFPHS